MTHTPSEIAALIRAILDHEKCEVNADGIITYRDPVSRAAVSVDIEDAFGIADIDEDEAEKCRSVDDWVVLVGRMVK